MPITANATPTVLYSDSPGLPLREMIFMERYQHVSLGRVWVLDREPLFVNGVLADETSIVLVDAANDGAFDNVIVDQADSLYQQGILGASTVLVSYDND